MPDHINTHLSPPLSEFVALMVGDTGLYETPDEYVRDLIRRDMEKHESHRIQDAILSGYQDWAAGRIFASTGDFKADMVLLEQKEAHGWQ
jgi:antitoxin ParD1/3/4